MATSVLRSRRRWRALLVLLGLVFALVEPAVADACDGATFESAADVMSVMEPEGTSTPANDGHALHLCHCMHAHSGIVARTQDWRSQWSRAALLIGGPSTRMPLGPDIPARLRPPSIARI